MNVSIFLMLRVSMFFLLAFLWCLQFHRYGRLKSLMILVFSFAATAYPDLILASNVGDTVSAVSNLSTIIELVVVSLTIYLFSAHRDNRAVLVGIAAGTYDLSGVAVEAIFYFYTRNSAASIAAETTYLLVALFLVYCNNHTMPLTEMLETMTDRWKLCLITALNFISNYAAAVWPGNVMNSEVSRVLTIIMIALTLAYYALVLSLLDTQMKKYKLEKDNELLENYTSNLERRMKKEKENQEKLSILRHDMRHRENMILNYLDSGDTQAIREMLTLTGEKLSETVTKKYSFDSMLNMILSDAAQKASKGKTRFECRIEVDALPKDMRIELTTVELNLLENALTAAAAVPDEEKRFVSFSIVPVKSQLKIEIDNAYAGELKCDKDTGLPLLKTLDGHGYGLRSVLAFIKKYNIPYVCETSNGIYYFKMLVPNEKTN